MKTMSGGEVITITEAARECGVYKQTIRDLIRGHNIQTKPVPRNGSGRGLDPADMAIIRRSLGLRTASTS